MMNDRCWDVFSSCNRFPDCLFGRAGRQGCSGVVARGRMHSVRPVSGLFLLPLTFHNRLRNPNSPEVEEPEVHRLTSDPRRFHTPRRTHSGPTTYTPSTLETPIRRSSNAHLMELSASQGFGAVLLSPVNISRSLPRATPPRFGMTGAGRDESRDEESSMGFSEFTELDGGNSDSFTGHGESHLYIKIARISNPH